MWGSPFRPPMGFPAASNPPTLSRWRAAAARPPNFSRRPGPPAAADNPAFSPFPATTSTPFIPPGIGSSMPAGPSINHYFPGTPAQANPPLDGVSEDYIGYPSSDDTPSPFANSAVAPEHTPADPSPAGLAGGWAGPAPGINYPTASGLPPTWQTDPPLHAFTSTMFPEDAWGSGDGFTSPPGWRSPMHGGPGMPPHLTGGMTGMGEPPGVARYMQAPPDRAMGVAGDRMNPWTAGPNCGPVLEPSFTAAIKADIKINPLLLPPDDNTSRDYMKWNMLFPPSYAQRSSDPDHVSWSKGRDEPATFPRTSYIRLVCVTMPYLVDVRARNRDAGVTCGDVLDSISENLYRFSGQAEYQALPAAKQRQLAEAYRYNRSRAGDVPGGMLGEGMKRLDWLAQESIWDGIVPNDDLVRIGGERLPCTFQLRTTHRFLLTASKPTEREELRRGVAAEEANERSRREARKREARLRNRASDRSQRTRIEEVSDEGV